jgi:LacI family transcriptional regulator, repressor for deo operon, udp, cdd, tsx, nupC, and nupG
MATMEQVAKIANVSVATVSRVLNNPNSVSPDTRQRVQDVIKKLNYEPNLLGRSLRKTETNLILVLLHAIDNPFFSKIIRGIENIAHIYNYDVIVANNYGDRQLGEHYVDFLRSRLVDGVILLSSEFTAEELDRLTANYPVVQTIEYNPDSNAPAITIDYYQASCELMEHLISLGKHNIAFLNANDRPIISTDEKFRAYIDTLNKYQLPIITKSTEIATFGYFTAKDKTNELLKNHPTIDAIFACSDMLACGAIDACLANQLKVPEDVAVVGFDNIAYSEIFKPSITTISHNSFNLGLKSMEVMLQLINGEKLTNHHLILPHKLYIRQSTKQ